VYVVTLKTGYVMNTRSVTIPKLPPPPPRQAQKRSAFSSSLQVRRRPSAVTSVSSWSASQVRPCLREMNPTPPPSVMPAMPTVGQDPEGIAASSCQSRS
jgi:hypothetical protein